MPLLWLAALASTAAAATVVPPAADPATTTIQQRFDAASDAAARRDCAKAVPLFEALERDPRMKPGSLAAAAAAVRRGACLVRLGREEEGEAAIQAGLPRVSKAGAQFAGDVANAESMLGDAALARWDYQKAQRHFEAAAAMQSGAEKMVVLSRLARATAFDGGTAAIAAIDEALRIAAADPSISNDVRAQLYALRGRALLNQGRNEDAYVELKRALDLSGGLTLKTSFSEVSIRGDLALAAMLLGKKDDARHYLAYTGQGRLEKAPFNSATSMTSPECGEASGLRPQDFAVVEFGIGEDGAVIRADTIYSRGGQEVAAAFAKAVSSWYWMPEAVKDIPPFFRLSTRVELRCTAAGGPSQRIEKELSDRFADWALRQTGVALSEDDRRQATLEALSRVIADTRASGPFARHAAAVGLRAVMELDLPATVTSLDALLRAPEASALPSEVRNTLRYYRIAAARAASFTRARRITDADRLASAQELLAFAAELAVAADPLTAATAKLSALAFLHGKLAAVQRAAAVKQVAEDDRLGAGSRLRQYALLQLANDAASSGDLAAAQSYFQRTGLTEQQCALLGPTPEMRKNGTAVGFPLEAMQYGFEGWVRLEYDITADGAPVGSRAVIAYPPFIFVDGATKMSQAARFRSSYRPGGSMACSANVSNYRFVMRSPAQ